MPEYLAPGVFVEEVSFRSKSIEGVATSTTGFAGLTRFGPVYYPDGPLTCEPRLITSFTEFERVYGGLDSLELGEASPGNERVCYLAHAVRAFFENGGKRVYISRVFKARSADTDAADHGLATCLIPVSDITAAWQARWPGAAGNVYVETEIVRSKNIAYHNEKFEIVQARSVKAGAVVEVIATGVTNSELVPVQRNAPLAAGNLRVVQVDAEGRQTFVDENGNSPAITTDDVIQRVEMTVRVTVNSERVEEYTELAASPDQKRYIGDLLQLDNPVSDDLPVCLKWEPATSADPVPQFLPARLMVALQANADGRLAGGHDGVLPNADDFAGEEADVDDPTKKATGLEALGEVDDIAIVALPDSGALGDETLVAAQKLITHAEKQKYRIAIVDGPVDSSLNDIRNFRGQLDSKYAALYYPWIRIFDPTARFSQGAPPKQLSLPPSGFVAGIYARSDIERGVHKAPANEVVRGLTRFEVNINKPRQEVINPEGINALRFFEGRGYRVWGARTISSDPEWKYVNVRRLFIYIEHSIDNSTQWAVFEPNNRRLWGNIRRTVEDFLLVLWRDGALMGAKPEDAFFVRCDRTTMTQNDLDNGRMICLIGVAPVKPAEFVIFRIGQWTADAKV